MKGATPHPVPLPLGEGTLPHAPCVVFEAVRLPQRPLSQGERGQGEGLWSPFVTPAANLAHMRL
jgi:hypothetical protein